MNKPRNNPLIHKLTVRLDEPMYARLNDIASRSNQTLVECVRDLIVKGKVSVREVRSVELPGLCELTTEFSRIGNNLNQIARWLNSGGYIDRELSRSLRSALGELNRLKYDSLKIVSNYYGNHQAHCQ